uniref:Putative secreted protein n=1 Tax=Ixodes ricinus TaxID=34613 RepID=A0A6B0U7J9_IXORI
MALLLTSAITLLATLPATSLVTESESASLVTSSSATVNFCTAGTGRRRRNFFLGGLSALPKANTLGTASFFKNRRSPATLGR